MWLVLSKNCVIVYLFMWVMSAVRVLVPAHFISSWDSFDGSEPRQFLCPQSVVFRVCWNQRKQNHHTPHNNEDPLMLINLNLLYVGIKEISKELSTSFSAKLKFLVC